MKILVTGASGFIGGRLARFALEQGLQVRVNARRAEVVEPLLARGAELVAGELGDAARVQRLCVGVGGGAVSCRRRLRSLSRWEISTGAKTPAESAEERDQ